MPKPKNRLASRHKKAWHRPLPTGLQVEVTLGISESSWTKCSKCLDAKERAAEEDLLIANCQL